MIGLTTAQSVKPSYYQTRGRRPRVDDMTVSHDVQLLNIIVQRLCLVQQFDNLSFELHFTIQGDERL